MNNYAEDIKSTLTMQEVVESYGLEINRGGFTACPFHAEKTPSLKIYPEDRGFYCFGCREGGDVIKFVQHYFDIDFKAAITRLNYDFNLRLPIGERQTSRQRAENRRRAAERARQLETSKAEKTRLEQRYWELWGNWITSDINSRKYAPKSSDEEFHPLFAKALKSKDYQSYLIDLHT